MKKGQTYGYNAIEQFAIDNGYDIDDVRPPHGRSVVGECFLILRHEEKDKVVSFVLTGDVRNEYQYECVYSDLN